MSRRKLARRMDFEPPDAQVAQNYLLFFNSRDLFHTPHIFPRVDAPTLFGNDSTLKIEIGCGAADFICALALREPDSSFVGIDISWKPLFEAIRTASTLSLTNIKFIKANFKLMYPLLVPDSLQAVYLHFPDPNCRSKFRKRQIFSQIFLDQIYDALVAQGCLSVMTDHREFFMEMLALVEQDLRFAKLHEERFLVGFETEVKSRFQRIWEGHGLPTLRFEIKKL